VPGIGSRTHGKHWKSVEELVITLGQVNVIHCPGPDQLMVNVAKGNTVMTHPKRVEDLYQKFDGDRSH
jgi:hypothetical protein